MSEQMPGAFDIEAWIDGQVAPTGSVKVSSKAGLAGELTRLVAERADLQKQGEKPRRRMAEKDDTAERAAELDAQIETLAADLEGSWLEVEFRAPTPTERREAVKDEDELGNTSRLLALVGRFRPAGSDDDAWQTVPAATWRRLFDAIGNGQYQELSQELALLTYKRSVTPGFSQRALSYLETRRSGKN